MTFHCRCWLPFFQGFWLNFVLAERCVLGAELHVWILQYQQQQIQAANVPVVLHYYFQLFVLRLHASGSENSHRHFCLPTECYGITIWGCHGALWVTWLFTVTLLTPGHVNMFFTSYINGVLRVVYESKTSVKGFRRKKMLRAWCYQAPPTEGHYREAPARAAFPFTLELLQTSVCHWAWRWKQRHLGKHLKYGRKVLILIRWFSHGSILRKITTVSWKHCYAVNTSADVMYEGHVTSSPTSQNGALWLDEGGDRIRLTNYQREKLNGRPGEWTWKCRFMPKSFVPPSSSRWRTELHLQIATVFVEILEIRQQ